jgi:hypothetical protein
MHCVIEIDFVRRKMGMGIERGTFDGLKDERRKGERGVSLFEVDSLRPS